VNRARPVLAVALALLAGLALLRICRASRPQEPRAAAPPRVELPAPLPPAPPPAPEARAVAEGGAELDPARLKPFLERLGRARLLRDRETLARLRAATPPVFESDVRWILAQLRADLFTSAGAAELIASFRLSQAVPDLSEVLTHPAHPFLKGVVIETLASLGGDGAAVVLLAVLRADPDAGVRARCAAAVGAFAGPEVYHALIAALKDPIVSVRSAASQALARLPSREAVEALLAAAASEADPVVQADLAAAAYAAGGEPWREAVVQTVLARPAAAEVLRERARARGDARYGRAYDPRFFEAGGPPVPFDPSRRKIGITVEPGPERGLRDVASALFEAAPLDRYRGWFRLRKADEFPTPRAYDAEGNPAGDVPYDELDGTVFLRFRDARTFEPGVLGYTRGCEAFVTGVSLLHEFGHAFARLGDEYADGSAEDAANLSRREPAPWTPLVASGHLPPPNRRDRAFFVPSDNCHLGNNPLQNRFCPVCQLEILARLSELTGAPLPW
jgi:hypothetical protein